MNLPLLEIPLIILLNLSLGGIFLALFFGSRSRGLAERNKRLSALRKLDEVMMSSSTNLLEVAQKVTDAISFELGFEIGVLALVDEPAGVLRRVAMSRTATGFLAKKALPLPYDKVEIPLSFDENVSVQALKMGQRRVTHDLYSLFVPALDRATSEKIQKTVKVKTSLVYPVRARGKTIGVMIISISRDESQLSAYEKESIESLVDVVGIALDNAMIYESLESATEQLKNANGRLKELDQLKDDFVSVASHELRTPMTSIKSYLWMVVNNKGGEVPEKVRGYLNRAYGATERLIDLVNDMLNVSRIEGGRVELTLENFNMPSLAEEVVAEIKPKADEKGIYLKVEDTQNLPLVAADKNKTREVLTNLIGNSLKFVATGGVTVKFGIKASQIGNKERKFVTVEVWDTGSGISKEDQEHLFKKFGRLENSYVSVATTGGTGLGLYISRSLVELMGGEIGVDSRLGKGSNFWFILPQAV